MQFACDDPEAAWFGDSAGRLFMTLDSGATWQDVTGGLRGARVSNVRAWDKRTFVLWAQTDQGVFITRDGGMSWREAPPDGVPEFETHDFSRPVELSPGRKFHIDASGRLVRSAAEGRPDEPAMGGWSIPLARALFNTPWGLIASGPGGSYRTTDGKTWEEMKLWREDETGAADFLHAYWMGRYYGFLGE